MHSRLASSIERLEDRIAPSGLISVTYSQGHLVLAGDSGDHSLSIAYSDPSTLVLRALDGTGLVVNGKQQTDPLTLKAFTGDIKATLGAGNDRIDFGPGVFPSDVALDLGAGQNSVNAGDLSIAGHLTITGGAGADRVAFGGRNTTVGGNVAIDLGEGANEVASGLGTFVVGGNLGVKTGNGSDLLVFGGSGFAIAGDTTVTSGGGSDVVGFYATKIGLFGGKLNVSGTSAAGQGEKFTFSGDEQILFRGAIAIKTGDGDGAVALRSGGSLHAQSDISVDTGHGASKTRVTARDIKVDGSVSMSSAGGSDVKIAASDNLNITGDVKVSGGSGTDNVTISGGGKIAGKVSVDVGAGDHQSITLAGTHEKSLAVKKAVSLTQGGTSGTSLTTITNADLLAGLSVAASSANDTVVLKNVILNGQLSIATGSGTDVINLNGVPFQLPPISATVHPATPLNADASINALAAIIANAAVNHGATPITGSILSDAAPVDLTSAGSLSATSYLRTQALLSIG